MLAIPFIQHDLEHIIRTIIWCSLCVWRKQRTSHGPAHVCCAFHHIVAPVTFDYIVTTLTLDSIVVFGIIVTLFSPLITLLTSSPAMWQKSTL
jgi:hypothetical protein